MIIIIISYYSVLFEPMNKVIMKVFYSLQSSASGLFPVADGSIGKPAPTVTGDCLPPSTPECLERIN